MNTTVISNVAVMNIINAVLSQFGLFAVLTEEDAFTVALYLAGNERIAAIKVIRSRILSSEPTLKACKIAVCTVQEFLNQL